MPRQQRNVPHLREVHSNWITGRQRRLRADQRFEGRVNFVRLSFRMFIFEMFEKFVIVGHVGINTQIHAELIQQLDEVINHTRVAALVRQVVINLLVGDVANLSCSLNH